MESWTNHLRQALRTGAPPQEAVPSVLGPVPDAEYAAQRALLAWQSLGEMTPDVAVLVRQAARWSAEGGLFIGRAAPAFDPWWPRVDVEARGDGNLSARPYQPAWLQDYAPCDLPPQPRVPDEEFVGEPYLGSVKYHRWRSPGQKEAAWFALNTPPGGTRLVVLPTGSGKSLCFQLLPRFDGGLTVVVVPTVALAIDQAASAGRIFEGYPDVTPVYFAADEDAARIADQVDKKGTRLLFTSPEACVLGRLRPVLDKLAQEGWFTNLVVDEAHLVETWGAQFRVEFQFLAARRARWRERSGGKLRTFLFSATMTAECQTLLLNLFASPGMGERFVCQRLRPEMNYFHRFFAGVGRDEALDEALWRLPRPLIVYVTERDAARDLTRRLTGVSHGFRRVGCFHGETPRLERARLLRQWRENALDVMVATSAFGVGVDKPDVRAVVHACYPENLDRYYQEVGRGGRDGYSSVCLFLPSTRDREVAENLGVRLMNNELLQERWEAMYRDHDPVPEENGCGLPVRSHRRGLAGTFTYGENVRWNKRLLLQLHRAGLVELVDLRLNPPEAASADEEDPEEIAVVRLRFPPQTPHLAERIAGPRAEERARFDRGFAQMEELLSGRRCVARVLAALYGIGAEGRVCGGCPACRREKRPPQVCSPLRVPAAPTGKYRGEVVAECPDPRLRADRGDFTALWRTLLLGRKWRRFLVPVEHFETVLTLANNAMPADSAELYRVDPLDETTVITTPADEPLVFFHLGAISPLAFRLARGRRAAHLCTRGTRMVDADGRGVHVREDARAFHGPAAWLQAS